MDTSIEKKLAEYRRQKQVSKMTNYFKNFYKKMFITQANKVITKDASEKILEAGPLPSKHEDYDIVFDTDTYPQREREEYEMDYDDGVTFTLTHYLYFMLWFFLWGTLYGIFIKLQFGTVFVLLSALFAMYCNTRTGPKQENEISAYSVFNRDCRCIEGTLDGDKLTREMVFGI